MKLFAGMKPHSAKAAAPARAWRSFSLIRPDLSKAVLAAGAHSVDVKMNSKKGTEILKTLTNDIPYT